MTDSLPRKGMCLLSAAAAGSERVKLCFCQ